ncbi:MAG: hypothetical protein B7Z03_06280 [Hydrogenophilales bacterium 32-62-9]|nr:MAG: hypothetical protein B7Z03_06280 [Hydrogenophilales bacterium 32-62-9]
MEASGTGSSLAEFLAPGLIPEDIPPLFPLLAARPLIGALIALFRGGDEEVLIRLMVLREVGLRADAPEWTPRELESHFAYLSQTKLNTVLARLREHALLLWDSERRVYQLSTAGRMVLSALSNLLAFNAEQDGELGFLAGQIAAGAAGGKLAPEALSHLLARLGELEEEFAQAVASGSEFRLRAAQSKLASVQQWLDRANAVMKNLADAGLDDDSWRLAQSIGQRQSRLLRMASVFQRELAAIARQQVHLSQGGLSTSELAGWLKTLSLDQLAAFADGRLATTPECSFVLPDVMLDNTEEFIAREQPDRKTSAMPAPAEIEYTRDTPLEPPRELLELTRMLAGLSTSASVGDAVVGGSFGQASYRLSLLALIGETNIGPELAPLADLPLTLQWGDDMQAVGRGEVARISAGRILPQQNNDESPAA